MSELKSLIQDKLSKESFSGNGSLKALSQKGLELFKEQGIPTVKHEEWKYTRISAVLNKDFSYAEGATAITGKDVFEFRLPGYENAIELVFVNGIYDA